MSGSPRSVGNLTQIAKAHWSTNLGLQATKLEAPRAIQANLCSWCKEGIPARSRPAIRRWSSPTLNILQILSKQTGKAARCRVVRPHQKDQCKWKSKGSAGIASQSVESATARESEWSSTNLTENGMDCKQNRKGRSGGLSFSTCVFQCPKAVK